MYCLKIQGAEPTTSYICKYCNKNLSRKDSYMKHILSHEKNEDFMKYHYELEKLREINRNLESIIEIKEASIESLTKQTFTSKSDVWSFGILLWEITSFGMSKLFSFLQRRNQ